MLLQMSKKTFPVYRLKLQIKTEDQIKALVFPFWNHPAKNAISELSKNRISQTAFIKFHILVLSQRLILRKCYFFLPSPFKVEAASYLLTNNVHFRTASLEANSTVFCRAREPRAEAHLPSPRKPPLCSNRIWEINFLKWPCETNINDPWIKFHLVEQFRHHKYNGVPFEKSGRKNINRVWIYKASFGCDNSDVKH